MKSIALAAMLAMNSPPPRVEITLAYGPIRSAPADVTVKVKVPIHRDNRWLTVGAESGDFFRSSGEQLDGEHAPLMRWIHWRGLPAGEYGLWAAVADQQREVGRSTCSLLVIP